MSHTLAHSIEGNSRTDDVVISQNVSFESLFLSADVSKGLFQTGFRKPSPIQLKAIPVGRCGFDLIVKSKSGTGKTLVFSIIALESIDRAKKALQALILAPTREIAVQIQDVIKQVGCNIEGLIVESFIGGLSFEDDKDKCKNCQIAIGTPGRIKHLISEGILKCKSTRLFVLDEADKLMETSFRNDINQIYNDLPAKKQIITTSATYPEGLDQFLAQYMQSPTHVNAELETPLLLGLKQYVTVLEPFVNVIQQMKCKNQELLDILKNLSFTQCLIFSNYQTRAESISNFLNQNGWSSMFISAAQNQAKRLLALQSLKEFKCRIMLSTDLAARGIDAANVDLVINYDIPNDSMTYLHRMGRAGRYGAQGVCLNLAFEGKELERLRSILGEIGGTALGIPKLPTFEGHISDLMKIHVPYNEQIFGILDESQVGLTWDKNKIYELTKKSDSKENSLREKKERIADNSNNQQTPSSSIDANDKKENVKKCMKDSDSQNQSVVQNESELDKLKNNLADIDSQTILASLVNQTFNMKSETVDGPNKQSNTANTDTLLKLLNSEKEKPILNTIDELSEEERRQQLFVKNKALLDVVRGLDSPNSSKAKVDGSSITQYLNIMEQQDKVKMEAITKKSMPSILDSIQAVEPTKENVTDTENVSRGAFSLDNVFKLGYDCIVKSNDSLKQLLDTVEQGITNSSKECPMEGHESMEEDYKEGKEVEIMKWVPVEKTHTTVAMGKNLLEESSENEDDLKAEQEHEDVELAEWVPDGADSRVCLSDRASDEVEHYKHFGSYFDGCDQQLWQNGLNFESTRKFDEWFCYEWEAQLYAMRNYVQQNIYVQEMSRYQNKSKYK